MQYGFTHNNIDYLTKIGFWYFSIKKFCKVFNGDSQYDYQWKWFGLFEKPEYKYNERTYYSIYSPTGRAYYKQVIPLLNTQYVIRDISFFLPKEEIPPMDMVKKILKLTDNIEPMVLKTFSKVDERKVDDKTSVTIRLAFQSTETIDKSYAKKLMSPILAMLKDKDYIIR